MHMPPKDLRLESQCAPQQTPDEFALQELVGSRVNELMTRAKASATSAAKL
jgi:hypothetical protein